MSVYINIHTHQFSETPNTLTICNTTPHGLDLTRNLANYYSVGIHPMNINPASLDMELELLENQVSLSKVIAVGETGLDTFVKIDKKMQEHVFEQHIKLSEKYRKPLIIHCVRSFENLIRIKKLTKPIMPWIIHGYNANAYILRELQKHNCICSFGEKIMYPESNAAKALLSLEAYPFFLETDNTEIAIEEIYRQAAGLLNKPIEVLQNEIYTSFKQYFHL